MQRRCRENPHTHCQCLIELNSDFSECEDTSAKTPSRNVKMATCCSSLVSLTATGDLEELGSHEMEMDSTGQVYYIAHLGAELFFSVHPLRRSRTAETTPWEPVCIATDTPRRRSRDDCVNNARPAGVDCFNNVQFRQSWRGGTFCASNLTIGV